MSWPRSSSQRRADRPGGFTLVELLVTMAIIAMLAALTMGALASARQTARIQQTQATIEKINAIIMERYEAFHTRRLPLSNQDIQTMAASTTYASVPVAKRAPTIRLNALRDLMRMEMPDRWSDVAPSVGPLVLPAAFTTPLISSYRQKYLQALTATGGNTATVLKNFAAECLFMIVMSDPDAASQFHDYEIGDLDGDGLPEFLDGWGRPIRFLRWPAGFVPALNGDSDLQVDDPANHHDPFDPLKMDGGAYALYPLIYSAGPDGLYDINLGKDSSANDYAYSVKNGLLETCAADGQSPSHLIGEPLDSTGPNGEPVNNSLDHYDNIHNQRTEGR